MKGRSGQSLRRVGRWLPPASGPEQSRQSPVFKWISDYVDLGITLSDAPAEPPIGAAEGASPIISQGRQISRDVPAIGAWHLWSGRGK
jgi:hypothetical protein